MTLIDAISELFSLLKDESLSEDVNPFVIDVLERILHEKITEEDVKVFYCSYSFGNFLLTCYSEHFLLFDWHTFQRRKQESAVIQARTRDINTLNSCMQHGIGYALETYC